MQFLTCKVIRMPFQKLVSFPHRKSSKITSINLKVMRKFKWLNALA